MLARMESAATPLPGDLALDITALYLYPVKSCGALAVDTLTLDDNGGAAGDREWVVLNERGEVTWQGDHPRLALLRPRIEGSRLMLQAPGLHDFCLPDAPALGARTLKIWNERLGAAETFEGFDAGDEAAHWLAQATGAPLRMARLGEAALQRASVNRLHLISEESLADVNGQLARRGVAAVEPLRFRPNIVVRGATGPLQPFVEDHAEALHWHDGRHAARLVITSHCVRCVMPNIDLQTAAPGEQPLQLLTELAAQRRPGAPTTFGVYGRGPASAQLRVGTAASLALAF